MNLEKYAELVLKIGLCIKKDDELVIPNCDINAAPLCRAIVKKAYELGVKKVTVIYSDEEIYKLKALNENDSEFCNIAKWQIESREYIANNKACCLSIISDDPDIGIGINPSKLSKYSIARNKAFARFYDGVMGNTFRWSICAYPSLKWAKKLFPSLCDKEAFDKLDKLIEKTMRLDKLDPIKAWQEHQEKLDLRCNILNSNKIKKLHYRNSIGTDLEISPVKGYFFTGGREKSIDGDLFTANMPTEEIFTSPDRLSANGIVYASLPLVHNGNIIDKFYLEFKDGKIVKYAAKQGEEFLKNIINCDDGSKYLGEIALVPYNSPIQNMNTLFFETLFDENASCHLAIGEAYPTVKGAEKLSREEKINIGLNYSLMHVDFMIGTEDLSIEATLEDGSTFTVFRDGNFAF